MCRSDILALATVAKSMTPGQKAVLVEETTGSITRFEALPRAFR
jgi:hypothetical protein